jgi:hypothetical protein
VPISKRAYLLPDLRRIDAEAFNAAVYGYLAALPPCLAQELPALTRQEREQRRGARPRPEPPGLLQQAAADGKTVCGAIRPDGSQVHLLSVFDVTAGTARAQREVGAKTNEIPELAPAIAHLDLIGAGGHPGRPAHPGRDRPPPGQCLAESGDVHLKGVLRSRGRTRAPQPVDQDFARYRLVRAEQQNREQCALLLAADFEGMAVNARLNRPQQPVIDHRRAPHPMRARTRLALTIRLKTAGQEGERAADETDLTKSRAGSSFQNRVAEQVKKLSHPVSRSARQVVAARPGRVPVPRRGLRRDLAITFGMPALDLKLGTTVPTGPVVRRSTGTQRARSRLRTVGRPFSMRTSSEMVGEGRLRTSVGYIGAGGRLPLMWLLYSRAVRIPCGQGLGDGWSEVSYGTPGRLHPAHRASIFPTARASNPESVG